MFLVLEVFHLQDIFTADSVVLLTHSGTHFSSAPTVLGQHAPVEAYSPCRREVQVPLHIAEVTAFFNYFIATSLKDGFAAPFKCKQGKLLYTKLYSFSPKSLYLGG